MSDPGREATPERPEWGTVAFLAESKYRVVYSEHMGGWHVLSREYEQGMSAPARETTGG